MCSSHDVVFDVAWALLLYIHYRAELTVGIGASKWRAAAKSQFESDRTISSSPLPSYYRRMYFRTTQTYRIPKVTTSLRERTSFHAGSRSTEWLLSCRSHSSTRVLDRKGHGKRISAEDGQQLINNLAQLFHTQSERLGGNVVSL